MSVTETVDLGSILSRVKSNIIKISVCSFLAGCSLFSVKKDGVKPQPCVVNGGQVAA